MPLIVGSIVIKKKKKFREYSSKALKSRFEFKLTRIGKIYATPKIRVLLKSSYRFRFRLLITDTQFKCIQMWRSFAWRFANDWSPVNSNENFHSSILVWRKWKLAIGFSHLGHILFSSPPPPLPRPPRLITRHFFYWISSKFKGEELSRKLILLKSPIESESVPKLEKALLSRM